MPIAAPSSSSQSKQPEKEKESADRDADLLFDHDEMAELVLTVDGFATLVKAPDKEADLLASQAPQAALNAATGGMSKSSMAAAFELEQQGPLILRPIFCRFLLSSQLCGIGPDSPFKFHEAVAMFDERSSLFGAFKGMTRSTLCGVIAKVLMPPGGGSPAALLEDASPSSPSKSRQEDRDRQKAIKKAEMEAPSPKDRAREKMEKFFSTSLPLAREHCRVRHDRLVILQKSAPAVSSLDVPKEILAECAAENLWPPLPPSSITLREYGGYMEGIRQWEDEVHAQSAPRLLALRAHTETVVRGEVLVAQLLEPEVLHFATRFRPFFMSLFEAYSDWPEPDTEATSKSGQTGANAGKPPALESPGDLVDQEAVGLGHMSFASFFRFCVDFRIFPKHANFEEVQNIYMDAEAVRRVDVPTRITIPEDDALKLSSREGSKRRGSVSALPTVAAIASHVATKSAAKPRGKKLQLVIAAAATAAIAAAHDAMPKINLQFFDKPMASMSAFEIKTVAFFAAVDEWLSERSLRLTEVCTKTDISPAHAQITWQAMEAAAREASMLAVNVGADVVEHAGGIMSQLIPVVDDGTTKQAAGFRNQGEADAALKNAMRMANGGLTIAMDSMEPSVSVSPAGLLAVTASIKAGHAPTLEEMRQMFLAVVAPPKDEDDNATTTAGEAGAAASSAVEQLPLTIEVFQLDKVLRKAREVVDKARKFSCCLMRPESECTATEKTCVAFFKEINNKLFEKSQWMDGQFDDVFEDCDQLTPEVLLSKAEGLGVSPDLCPSPEDLLALLDDVTGKREGPPFCKRLVYRCISLMLEGQAQQRKKDMNKSMMCLTRSKQRSGERPTDKVFGLGAFVECTLKLALHRLSFKSLSDVQRGAPAWWKCTWLLTLLQGGFSEGVMNERHEQRIADLATKGEGSWEDSFSDTLGVGPPRKDPMTSYLEKNAGVKRSMSSASSDGGSSSKGTSKDRSERRKEGGSRESDSGRTYTKRGSQSGKGPLTDASGRKESRKTPSNSEKGPNTDAEVWWRKIQMGRRDGSLPWNMPPLTWLICGSPDLFEPENAETQIHHEEGACSAPCLYCNEMRSKSGWGNPTCAACNGVEDICLPIESHVFANLLKTEIPPQEKVDDGEEAEEDAVELPGPMSPSRRSSRRPSVELTIGQAR